MTQSDGEDQMLLYSDLVRSGGVFYRRIVGTKISTFY